MHEEPYAQAMLDMALEKAENRTITEICLGVGRFSAIVPASLEIFFSHLSRGTPAEKARLVFETIPVTLACNHCQKIITLDIPLDQPVQAALGLQLKQGCSCGGTKLSIKGGLTIEMISLKVVLEN